MSECTTKVTLVIQVLGISVLFKLCKTPTLNFTLIFHRIVPSLKRSRSLVTFDQKVRILKVHKLSIVIFLPAFSPALT